MGFCGGVLGALGGGETGGGVVGAERLELRGDGGGDKPGARRDGSFGRVSAMGLNDS